MFVFSAHPICLKVVGIQPGTTGRKICCTHLVQRIDGLDLILTLEPSISTCLDIYLLGNHWQ